MDTKTQIDILQKDKKQMVEQLDELRNDMQFLQAAIWNTEFCIDNLKIELEKK